MVKNPSADAGDAGDSGSVPRLGRSPAEGNGYPLQCSCLENPPNILVVEIFHNKSVSPHPISCYDSVSRPIDIGDSLALKSSVSSLPFIGLIQNFLAEHRRS